MTSMPSAFWEQVVASGHRVPVDRSLTELTIELTAMLGEPDEDVRERLAHDTLTAWVHEGVFDDLLRGFGDGIAAGLVVGLGAEAGLTVFRRASSASVLAACLSRDNDVQLMSPDTVLGWGDRLMGGLVRERDVRAYVPGHGRADAVGRAGDALTALARSRHVGALELTVLLDVLADRITTAGSGPLSVITLDRLAVAALTALRRDLVSMDVLEPWVRRLSRAAVAPASDPASDPHATDAKAFLRSLHLQLALASTAPACRADLLLCVIDALRRSDAELLG